MAAPSYKIDHLVILWVEIEAKELIFENDVSDPVGEKPW